MERGGTAAIYSRRLAVATLHSQVGTTPGKEYAPPTMTKFSRVLLLPVLAAFGLACGFPKAGPVPGPVSPERATAASTKWQGTTPESLAAGRETFSAKCNACHGHPDVSAIAEEKWPTILDAMAKKADLTPKQKDDVLHFILSARTPSTPGS